MARHSFSRPSKVRIPSRVRTFVFSCGRHLVTSIPRHSRSHHVLGFEGRSSTISPDVRMLGVGNPGSGKSSALGKRMFCAYVMAACGICAVAQKSGDAEEMRGWATQCGFGHKVKIFNIASGLRFDPLAYEWNRSGARGGGDTESLISFFSVLLRPGPSSCRRERRKILGTCGRTGHETCDQAHRACWRTDVHRECPSRNKFLPRSDLANRMKCRGRQLIQRR